MQFYRLSVAAFVCAVAAQNAPQDLASVISGNEGLSTLGTIISGIPGLSDALNQLSNVTILAPNNDAFSDLGDSAPSDPAVIQALLSYHVINGTVASENITDTPAFVHTTLTDSEYTNVTGGQVVEVRTVDGTATIFSGDGSNSTVVQADIPFSGGIIHLISSVLTIPVDPVSSPSVSSEITSLADVLTSTSLGTTIQTLSDVTIFAPNNAAFEAISSTTQGLDNETLSSILLYHLVVGTVGYSSLLTDDMTLTTQEGGTLTINLLEDGSVFVNGAEVVRANVLVPNGVLHIIDNVLNPSAADATPEPSATSGSAAFSGASSTPTPTGAAVSLHTGAAGMAALFGGAAVMLMI
ncbi:Fasciclin-domain-containing protein [Pseudovirgaria hyperparasitica]|uniref:Fasciclin-domain-containing protein n=1 Tax=Pseudovirgaria hyperparasitica TaxID=470096 RepID=A0A6A6WGE9_9PEZI|nr:Fasciclin-domain-containing protein [Pseudovirgaria hyperparasitica]KAF2761144.1 Fasciclin-domain-containing protein [Pseudovirgaria hyperparasitica]